MIDQLAWCAIMIFRCNQSYSLEETATMKNASKL